MRKTLGRVRRWAFFSRLLLTAVVLAISTMGFISQTPASDDMLRRRDLLKYLAETRRGLDAQIAGPGYHRARLPLTWPDLSSPEQHAAGEILQTAIMTGFSDGTFRPEKPVSRLELLFTWDRLIRFLWEKYPRCRPHAQAFDGMPIPRGFPEAVFWSGDDSLLSGFPGVLSACPADHGEVRGLMHQTMDFFVRPHLVLLPRPHGLEVWVKTLRGRGNTEKNWEFTLDGESWQKLAADNLIRISRRLNHQLRFRHPDFDEEEVTFGADELFPRLIALKAQGNMSADDHEAFSTVSASSEEAVLTGKVLDAVTRTPLIGASVAAGDVLVRTDETGSFQIPWTSGRRKTEMLVAAERYQRLVFKPARPLGRHQEILLNPFRTHLKGQVVSSASGKPIANAHIRLDGEVYTTDPEGEFTSQKTAPGYYLLEIKAPGFQAEKTLVFLEERPSRRTVKIHPAFSGEATPTL